MPESVAERRGNYVTYLNNLGHALRSDNPYQVSDARRTLARLRRAFVEGRPQGQAYQIVYKHDPPSDSEEAEIWLLLGSLFALHPASWNGGGGRHTIGASLGRLHRKLDSPAVERRLMALLARDKNSLPHHLRQAVRLLSAHDVPVHYGRLLDDLLVLLGDQHRGDRASKIRLKWAEEYYREAPATDSTETTE
ncbi:type I-E CRISPR-associated protein Cse2/CasB [Spongiactinospora gelatinilytica]|uniref:Type I-E CRISPR-associated protein Cse2/CasB n=1 Tax=Spongiactinospora gelatinilytica TaxID=2666298 RepID=A0A2W2G008_9ACTN|nr:type I-E CRISPR-associated protein Cse2/CasB [Spongiactinospora gelatinilytica]PZG41391.1 type I-E CRISPR-associated protein Cse2/CasB [Spongiactinospora gelatinilytica]